MEVPDVEKAAAKLTKIGGKITAYLKLNALTI